MKCIQMSNNECPVDGCTKAIRRKGFCYGHYMKNWRYGTPTPVHPRRESDLIGKRFGSLEVLEFIDGKWSARCDCGTLTRVRAGDLNRGSVSSCGDWVRHHRLEVVGYGAAHERLYKDLGRADSHRCADCGGPAQHWSYDHMDREELYRHDGLPYSLNPDHYSPRCVPCHKRFDLQVEERGRVG